MPVPTRVETAKNLWVAAGDGDLDRVKELIEEESMSPNEPDHYTYTPMHAAASYGHIQVLEYLLSKGGDINIVDDDNETPLYNVESVEVAQWMIEHGAKVDWKNSEGVSPVGHLSEEFPQVSSYLATLLVGTATTDASPVPSHSTPAQPSNYATEQSADELTKQLMSKVRDVMQRSEADGRDPEEELRQIVGETVLEGMLQGVKLGEDAETQAEEERSRRPPEDEGGSKRSRIDHNG